MVFNLFYIFFILFLMIFLLIFIINFFTSRSREIVLKKIQNVLNKTEIIKGYITYNPQEDLKRNLNNLFFKLINILNQKNEKDLEEVIWMSESLKENIKKNFKNIKLIKIGKILETNILEKKEDFIKVAFISLNLENEKYSHKDILDFSKKNEILQIINIYTDTYTDNYNFLENYITNKEEKK